MDTGRARAIVNAAIRDAVADLEDRGDDGKPRKVVITLEMIVKDNGLIEAHVEAVAKVPARRTACTMGRPKRESGVPKVYFQGLAPEDPEQRTIDELAELDELEGKTQ